MASLNSEVIRRLKNFDQEFGPPIERPPQTNPDADLYMLKELAMGVETKDTEQLRAIFDPFVDSVSLEKWHALLIYVWDKVLGHTEFWLWAKCGVLANLCVTRGAHFENSQRHAQQALAIQSKAFTPPPLLVNPSMIRYDAATDRVVLSEAPTFMLVEESIVYPSFDVTTGSLGKKKVLDYVLRLLATFVEKRSTLEQVRKMLDELDARVRAGE